METQSKSSYLRQGSGIAVRNPPIIEPVDDRDGCKIIPKYGRILNNKTIKLYNRYCNIHKQGAMTIARNGKVANKYSNKSLGYSKYSRDHNIEAIRLFTSLADNAWFLPIFC